MQLDQTRIAIRQRSTLELLDLSLHVTRVFLQPLLTVLLLGVLPWMLANYFLVGWMLPTEVADFEAIELSEMRLRYFWNLALLMLIEAPLATMFVTAYLGQAMFVVQPRIKDTLATVGQSWFRLLWCFGFRRALIPGVGVALLLTRRMEPAVEVLLLGGLAAFAVFCRTVRPYLLEIIVLERNPLRGGRQAMTIARRNASLHSYAAGDLFGRWFVAAGFGAMLCCSLAASMLFVQGAFFNHWQAGPFLFLVGWPAAAWLVTGLLAVFRYLSYLDLRIRQEGWEVELLLRAEAARLQEEMAMGVQ